MKKLNFEQALDTAWKVFKANALGLIVVYGIYMIVSGAISQLLGGGVNFSALSEAVSNGDYAAMASSTSNSSSLASFVSVVVSFLFTLGFTWLLLRLVRNQIDGVNQQTVISSYQLPTNLYLKAFAAYILDGFAIVIGCCLCVVPGIIAAIRLQYAVELLLDNPELGIIDALKGSWNLTAGNTLVLFGIMLVGIVITCIGFACCCVGAVAAIPFISVLNVVAYIMLRRAQSAEPAETTEVTEA